MWVTDVDEDGVSQVEESDQCGRIDNLLINGPTLLAVGGTGQGHFSFPAVVAYNEGAGYTPANGETWGVAAGSWLLEKNLSGFVAKGGADNGKANFVATHRPWRFKARITARSAATCGSGSGSGSGVSSTAHTVYQYKFIGVRHALDGDGCPAWIDTELGPDLSGTAFELNNRMATVGTVVSMELVFRSDFSQSGSGEGIASGDGCVYVFEADSQSSTGFKQSSITRNERICDGNNYRILTYQDSFGPDEDGNWGFSSKKLRDTQTTECCRDCNEVSSGSGSCCVECHELPNSYCLIFGQNLPIGGFFGQPCGQTVQGRQVTLTQTQCESSNGCANRAVWHGETSIGTVTGAGLPMGDATIRATLTMSSIKGTTCGCIWTLVATLNWQSAAGGQGYFLIFDFANSSNCEKVPRELTGFTCDAFSSTSGGTPSSAGCTLEPCPGITWTLTSGACSTSGSGGSSGSGASLEDCGCVYECIGSIWSTVGNNGCTVMECSSHLPVGACSNGEKQYKNCDGTVCTGAGGGSGSGVGCSDCGTASRTATWSSQTGLLSTYGSTNTLTHNGTNWSSAELIGSPCIPPQSDPASNKIVFWCENGTWYCGLTAGNVGFAAESGGTCDSMTFNLLYLSDNTICPGQTGSATITVTT